MKHVKSLLALVLTLMLVCGMAVVPAFAAEGTMVGDAKIFLPSTGAVKVQYTLTSDGTTAVADAAYSITKVENADDSQVAAADVWQYAQIDAATGDLYVSQAAKGKEIFISATSADYTGSISAVVSETSLSTDFENETDGSLISNPIFNATTVKAAAGNGGLVAQSTATAVSSYHNDLSKYKLTISPENFVSRDYTIQLKMSSAIGAWSNGTKYFKDMSPVIISYDNDAFNGYCTLEGQPLADEVNRLRTVWKPSDYGYFRRRSQSVYDYKYVDQYLPLTLRVVNNKTVTMTYELSNESVRTWTANLNSAGTVAGTQVTTFGFGCYLDDLEIYTGERITDTSMFAPFKVVGDSKLFLPSSGTIKVQYGMANNAGEAITEGVTYTLSGENVASYAQINDNGELLIDSQALGRTFTITATANGDSASKTITTNSVSLSENFEDEVVGQTVSNAIFAGTTTKTITEGQMKSVYGFAEEDITKTNKIGHGHHKTTGDSYSLIVRPEEMKSEKITIELKTGIHKQSDFGTEVWWPAMNNSLGVTFGSGSFTVNLANNKVETRVGGSWKANAGLNGYGADYYYQLIPLKVVIENNNIIKVKANDYQSSVDVAPGNTAETGINAIEFQSFVDDIEIYSGERYAGAYTISGEDFLLAPSKSTTSTSYNYTATVANSLPWEDANATVTWGLASNYAGVSVDANGKLTVNGSAANGNIVLQAKDASGAVVGEKTVLITRGNTDSIYTYYWIDNRVFYQDFEKYEVGANNLIARMGKPATTYEPAHPGPVIGSNTWDDFLIAPTSNTASAGVGTIVQEENGNKYVSSYGRKWWTVSANGSGLSVSIADTAFNNNTNKQTSDEHRIGDFFQMVATNNLEFDMMFEGQYVVNMDPTYTQWSVLTDDSDALDIFYKKLADDTVGVYLGTVNGVTTEDGAPLIAVMPVDTWFSLRLEQNNATKTVNVYIDGRLVAENVVTAMGDTSLADRKWWFGAAVDNIQMYAGSATAAAANTEIKVGTEVQNVGFATSIAMTSGKNAVSVVLNEAAPANISADAKIIIARYGRSGKLIKMTSAPVSVVNGKLYGGAALRDEYATGDTVKAFLWNWGTLQPVK